MDTCPACSCLLTNNEKCDMCGYVIAKKNVNISKKSSVFDIFDFIDNKPCKSTDTYEYEYNTHADICRDKDIDIDKDKNIDKNKDTNNTKYKKYISSKNNNAKSKINKNVQHKNIQHKNIQHKSEQTPVQMHIKDILFNDTSVQNNNNTNSKDFNKDNPIPNINIGNTIQIDSKELVKKVDTNINKLNQKKFKRFLIILFIIFFLKPSLAILIIIITAIIQSSKSKKGNVRKK